MELETSASTTTIKVIVRHSKKCKKAKPDLGQDSKDCNCRKSIYIYENGKDHVVSAKTRSWEAAEKLVQEELDKRDPVQKEMKELKERLAAKEAETPVAQTLKDMAIIDATSRWCKAFKAENSATELAHETAAKRLNAWAKDNHIETVREVTFDALDAWRAQWGVDIEFKYNRIGYSAQRQFRTYLKSIFSYVLRLGYIDKDPAEDIAAIKYSKIATQPLSDAQFVELLAAIKPYCANQTGILHDLAEELEIILQIQIWTGLRMGDVVALKRSSLCGNRLSLITQKGSVPIVGRIIPDAIAAKLAALSLDRPDFRKEYFFWKIGVTSTKSLSSTWETYIANVNAYLHFVDDIGNPMRFHSHMLRDTFAVRLLLKGVPIEEVSKLLTHSSVLVTEKYYAPWIRARWELLELHCVAVMRDMGMTVTIETQSAKDPGDPPPPEGEDIETQSAKDPGDPPPPEGEE